MIIPMIRLKPVSLACCFLLVATLACSSFITDPNEQFIQGKWSQSGSNDGHAWYLTYTFNSGSFTVEGYPPLRQTGSYRVVSSVGDVVVLEFYNQKGDWGTQNTKETLTLVRAQDQFSLDGGKTFFTRVK
jgi:hypothetical protein